MSATYKIGGFDAGLAHQREEFRSSITSAGVLQGQARKTVTAFGLGYNFRFLEVAALANLDEYTAANGTREKATEYALGVSVPLGNFVLNAMAARGRPMRCPSAPICTWLTAATRTTTSQAPRARRV